jgi:acetyl-CoA carboxylase biotin carboxyl carrier protein
MTLSVEDIGEIAQLLSASHYCELKLELGDFTLHMRGHGGGSRGHFTASSEAPLLTPTAPVHKGAPGANEVDVPAPFLGIFYHAPGPGHAAFVEPGQQVTEESVIGILEVMKLMNVVRAGVCGTIIEMLVPNAESVEEGQPLVRVKVSP